MSIPLSLAGKVALISGGSRGIGAATVRMFAAAGAKVVFSYRSARSQAEALAKECGPCHPVACDLNNPEAARLLVAKTVEHFGRLDILIANHGVWPVQDVPIERMSDEQWRSTMSINLDGVFGLVKHAVAQMKAQPRTSGAAGHIVLISSTSGQRGEAYQYDKGAVHGAGIGRNLRKQRCAWLGRYRNERRSFGRSEKRRRNPAHDSVGTGGQTGRDCRTGAVPVYPTSQFHHGGSFQRKRRSGPGRLALRRRDMCGSPTLVAFYATGSAPERSRRGGFLTSCKLPITRQKHLVGSRENVARSCRPHSRDPL